MEDGNMEKYSKHVEEILKFGLTMGSYSDVLISVADSRQKIRCHRAVLAAASDTFRELLVEHQTEEELEILLCDTTFTEAMALLNLIYLGRVEMQSGESIVRVQRLAITLFNLSLTLIARHASKITKPGRKRASQKEAAQLKNSKRPLLIKSAAPQLPSGSPVILLFTMPPATLPLNTVRLQPKVQHTLQPVPAVADTGGARTLAGGVDSWQLNSYQKAKHRNATKHRCEECGRAFPLGSLLQRHLRSHSTDGKVVCSVCGKGFGSKTTHDYHMFSKHTTEKIARLAEKKQQLEQLKSSVANSGLQFLSAAAELKAHNLPPSCQAQSSNQAAPITETVQLIDVQDFSSQMTVQIEGDMENNSDNVEVVIPEFEPSENPPTDSFQEAYEWMKL